MSTPDISIKAGDLHANVWRIGTHLRAAATVYSVQDAHAVEIPADGDGAFLAFSALTMICADGSKLTVHLPPEVATRMAAAFHAPDRLPAVTAALDAADRQSVTRDGMTEVPTRALMELRKALDPVAWAYATSGEIAE